MKKIVSPFVAGCCIGTAGISYLSIGGIIGAAAFSFGLIAVIWYQLELYTGKAQLAWGKSGELDYLSLLRILIFNVIGCGLMSLFIDPSKLCMDPSAIVNTRLHTGALVNAIKAVPCGFIMTMAVNAANKSQLAPLLFGVPTFITCGFPHCIADVLYYAASPQVVAAAWAPLLLTYLCTIVGNYFGCNLYRAFQDSTPIVDKK